MATLLALFGDISAIIGTIQPIVGEAVRIANRVNAFKDDLSSFQVIEKALPEIQTMVIHASKMLERNKSNMDDDARAIVERDARLNKIVLDEVNAIFEDLLPILRQDRGVETKRRRKFIQRARHFHRADDINGKIQSAGGKIETVRTFCQSLVSVMTTVRPRPIRIRSFTPSFSVPVLPVHVVSNFNDSAAEARLKAAVLGITSTKSSGVPASIAVVGMGGIGKTTVITALGWDTEVREKFPDGIYFLRIGQKCTEQQFTSTLNNVLKLSGGLDDERRLQHVVDRMKIWFTDKKALFLCDDVWSTNKSDDGHLQTLQYVISSSAQTCLVFTTRDHNLARRYAVSYIAIDPLDRTGSTAMEIFVKLSNRGTVLDDLDVHVHSERIMQILTFCAGVPLTIAVAASSVANIREDHDSWGDALAYFNSTLESNKSCLLNTGIDNYPQNLAEVIHSSLHLADQLELEPYMRSPGMKDGLRTSKLFKRFCVLEKQTVLSTEALATIWTELSRSGVNRLRAKLVQLNLLHIDDSFGGQISTRAHDLIVDYCTVTARNEGTFYEIHKSFLDGFIKELPSTTASFSQLAARLEQPSSLNRWLEECTRPWWNLPRSSASLFAMDNLARVLRITDRETELLGVLTHGEWTRLRLEISDIGALLNDFESLISGLDRCGVDTTIVARLRDVVSDLHYHVRKNLAALPTQARGRLQGAADGTGILQRYVNSFVIPENRVWLRPIRPLWRTADGRRFVTYHTGSDESEIFAGSCRTRRAYTVLDGYLIEVSLSTREVCRRIRLGHACVGISPDGAKLTLMESDTNVVFGFDVRAACITFDVRLDPDAKVECNAWTPDGAFLAIGGRVKTGDQWHEGTGWIRCIHGQSGEIIFEERQTSATSVTSLAFSRDGRTLAFGTLDGNLRVLDVRNGNVLWAFSTPTACTSGLADSAERGGGDRYSAKIRYVGIEPGKKLIVAESSLAGVMLWRDWTQGIQEDLSSFWPPAAAEPRRLTSNSVLLNEDGDRLILITKSILKCHMQCIDVSAGAKISTFGLKTFSNSPVGTVRFCDTGTHIVFRRYKGLCFWDTSTSFFSSVPLSAHPGHISKVQFSEDMSGVLCFGEGAVSSWGLHNGKLKNVIFKESGGEEKVIDSCFVEDQTVTTLVETNSNCGSDVRKKRVQWLDMRSREILHSFEVHAEMYCMASSQDGNRVALISSCGLLELCDRSGASIRRENGTPSPRSWTQMLRVSHDGSKVIVGDSNKLIFVSVEQDFVTKVLTFEHGRVEDIVMVADCELVLCRFTGCDCIYAVDSISETVRYRVNVPQLKRLHFGVKRDNQRLLFLGQEGYENLKLWEARLDGGFEGSEGSLQTAVEITSVSLAYQNYCASYGVDESGKE